MDAGFYGNGVKKTRLTERISNAMQAAEAEDAKTKRGRSRLCNPFMSSLLGPAIIWKYFPKQSEALEYCRSIADVHIFAFECADLPAGARRFLVTSYEHFWHDYMLMDDDQRALYEVIPEETPVKLYFDVEFVKDTNPQANAEEIIVLFLSLLSQTFTEVFSVPLPLENLVQLDSSTLSKFSQHFIFPKAVFRDFRHAGLFVTHFCRNLQDSTSDDVKKLFLHSKDLSSPTVLFIDQGVYTKNRNFRVYLSSKLGKKNPFVLYHDSPLQDLTQKEIFFLSLICNTQSCKSEDLLHFDTEKFPVGKLSQNTSESVSRRFRSDGDRPSLTSSNLPSPFPEVDKFFESVITADGLMGRIRMWQYFAESQTVLYSIGGDYRFCGHIGRHHRSNNINFVACLKSGTYHQKCLDVECKNYRSQNYKLPLVLVNEPASNESAVPGDRDESVPDDSMNEEDGETFDAQGDKLLADMSSPDDY
ncbi:hypothetical protein RvY_16972 [Ramazzottius varieornatus]|uniref:DNA-directed primase/polymerase protein n=1 Tax=Ramazzottius varieornatus TaxID=947166 RepID=A0A1D1W0F7_RAMVA|nr:hypothetical protein RvY_16972 [Ramazzottius varieornatus]